MSSSHASSTLQCNNIPPPTHFKPLTPSEKGCLSLEKSEEQDEKESQRSQDVLPMEPNTDTPETHTDPNPRPHKPRWRRYISATGWYLLDQWFLLALALLILIASQVQVPGPQQKNKERVVTYLCVSVNFIITGLTLPTPVLAENYGRWKIHLFVQVQSFLMTSAIVYAVVSLCATSRTFMAPGLLVGMIVTGCVPTTISSNVVMTRQARGNQALTVVQSTLGNLLGPFLTPLLIRMYTAGGAWYTQILSSTESGGFGKLYQKVFIQLGLSLFLPLVVGQVIQNLFPTVTKKIFISWKLNKITSLCLLVIIWQTYDQAFESGAFQSLKSTNLVFIVLISISYYMIWTCICVSLSVLWLDKTDTIAVAYCVPAKTPAMGVPLTAVMFSGLPLITKSKIQIPMVIFQGFQIAAGSLMTVAFRRWLQSEEERERREKDQERDDKSTNV